MSGSPRVGRGGYRGAHGDQTSGRTAFHGASADPQQLGEIVLGHVGVVPEDDDLTFARR